jgi:hypothetical protein
MFAELLKAVEDLTVRHGHVKIEPAPGLLPKGHYFAVAPGGQATVHKAPEPPMNAVAHDFATVVKLASAGTGPEVWFDPFAVTGHLDPAVRPDVVTMKLVPSTVWKHVEALAGKTYKQAEFLRMCRLQLGDAIDDADYWAVKKVLFKHNQETSGAVDRSKASMGRSIQNSLEGEAPPERVTLSVQVYENLPYTVKVECNLELDLDKEEFAIIPRPLQLARATDAVMALVGRDLATLRGDALWPIYFGRQRAA